ncbi:sulfatase domain-containing protein [Blastomyces gilchristii SLH14081]|uniref:Sulfatase domain-containing protein n=1 Tax=Blastomyces gilchristii (strain SLH14081) TaxID=559298 RepID=A0A179V042_BLAGS|nr:sulfatase domain-containing protein [Blastomyces gilchristii SLH14081]OAT11972.1 sulfatase domain-containing protein [Blastomyces gilchristii SLH14081]
MSVPSFRVFQPFLFSVLVVALLAAKLLHLFQHARSIPLLRFVVYFPTFFIQDCFVIIVQRLLLNGQSRNLYSILGLSIGAFLTTISLGASAAQFGFYYVTGGELQWDAAGSVASDPAAMRLMLSGIMPVTVSGLAMLLFAWPMTPILYNKTGFWLTSIWKLISPGSWDMLLPIVRVKKIEFSHQRVVRLWPPCALTTLCSLTVLQFIRPAVPYDHISATLPVAMSRMLQSNSKGCARNLSQNGESFPLPELLVGDHWMMPKDNFKGWAPGKDNFFIQQYFERARDWIPERLPAGFERWDKELMAKQAAENKTMTTPGGKDMCPVQVGTHYYNPVADPLRISNLNLEPYEELREALKDILISHVVLITMESSRKDMFPIQQGSYIHKQIHRSYKDDDTNRELVDKKLSQLTRVAEQVTGESFFSSPDKQPDLLPGVWRDKSGPDMGGINVVGANTGSTLSFKSVLGSHCGVGPLPEDFLEEVNAKIYQPCIPQVVELFNRGKKKTNQKNNVREALLDHRASVHRRKWESVFVQSITDQYDRQDVLNRQMSFGKSFSRETLENESSKYFPPKSPELNYFGYAESEVKPFIRDLISETIANNKRLFLSHFTSTTHHPWAIPHNFRTTNYMGSKGSHEHMNSFLNVVRYDDLWLGELLGLLDEHGIANETLVVIVGDHGQAFEEDDGHTGTYENGHISNFRVPLVFRHPHLPRIHVATNATSMSILPTILDLLVSTNSLDPVDTAAAADLMHDYEAQSLLRPYMATLNGRQAWNFGVINAGGSLLAVMSAAVPYRIVIPLAGSHMFRFTHIGKDPNELHPLERWTLNDLAKAVNRSHGEEASKWAREADAVGRWWAKEMHRVYNYNRQ